MAESRAFPLSPVSTRRGGLDIGVEAAEEALSERYHKWRTKNDYRPFRIYHLKLIIFLGVQVFEWLSQAAVAYEFWRDPDEDEDEERHRNTAGTFLAFIFLPWIVVALILTFYGREPPMLPAPEKQCLRVVLFPFVFAYNFVWYMVTDIYLTFSRFGYETVRYLYNLFVDHCWRPADAERLERESSIPPYRMRSYIFFRGVYQFLFESVPNFLILIFVLFNNFHEYRQGLVATCIVITAISIIMNLLKIIRFRKETKLPIWVPAGYSMITFRKTGASEKQILSSKVTVSCGIDEFPWVDFYNDVYQSMTLKPVPNDSLHYFKNVCRLASRTWQLQHFIAARCHIADDGPLNVQHITEAMRRNHGLKLLDLSHNIISNKGCVPLSELIGHTTTLTALDISFNRIGEEGFSFLSNALKVNVTLKMLDVSNNRLAPGSAVDVGNFLRLNFNLVDLRLNNCRFDDDSMKGIAKGLRANRILKKLWMRYNDIGPEGMEYLSQALAENNKLNQLALEGNHVGDDGVKSLCEIIPHNESLSTIELVSNQIGDAGALHLGDAIWRSTMLQHIYLSNNAIGDAGMKGLAEGLAQAKELRHLSLVKNKIGNNGAVLLANALKRNTKLAELHLGGNFIGDEGVTAIANALCENKTLEVLTLEDNPFGEEGAGHLCDALRSHDNLKTLLLDGQSLSHSMVHNLRNLNSINNEYRVSIRLGSMNRREPEAEPVAGDTGFSQTRLTVNVEAPQPTPEQETIDIPVIPSQFQNELRTTILAMENITLGMEDMSTLNIMGTNSGRGPNA